MGNNDLTHDPNYITSHVGGETQTARIRGVTKKGRSSNQPASVSHSVANHWSPINHGEEHASEADNKNERVSHAGHHAIKDVNKRTPRARD